MYMKVQLASKTLDLAMSTCVYWNKEKQEFKAHDILGLYKDKSVRAIGRIVACITALKNENEASYKAEFGDLTDEREAIIKKIILERHQENLNHWYYFVDEFYETDFKKVTKHPLRGAKLFDLSLVLGTDDILDIKTLAEQLRHKTWS